MDALLARYLDGDLSEEEARVFLDRLEQEPGLAWQLRDHERLLAAARQLDRPAAPGGFTDRVMERIVRESSRAGVSSSRTAGSSSLGPMNRGFRWNRWASGLAMAAVLVLAFGLGRVTVDRSGVAPAADGLSPSSGSTLTVGMTPGKVATVTGTTQAPHAADFRIVRLVYVPRRDDVRSVSVAGSFNGWNARSLPMKREGGVWTTTLVLPPGSYEYMFVENGKRWVTDPLATHTRDDGFGNRNAVLDLGA